MILIIWDNPTCIFHNGSDDMKRRRHITALCLVLSLCLSLCGCSQGTTDSSASGDTGKTGSTTGTAMSKAEIENALDLSAIRPEWTYSEEADAWTMSSVTAVTNPEIEKEQGVSVCVPGAYVKGIDTDGDGVADETSGSVNGTLVLDAEASVTSTNGQVYTAATAPVIVNTGAEGYSEQENQTAASTYAAEGYINVTCGNRGKQSTTTDADGNTVYTGDAPFCLVDQKNAVRFVKYNILLGNLPGSVDYFVSTGGSGGGAHAAMLAATSDNPTFYDYEIAAGAVGVYQNQDGSYTTSVTIDGKEVELSDGMWGCMAYSAITSLAEADMALAFEYNLDATYDFNTAFQKQTAAYLAAAYMDYINGENRSVKEKAVGFDLNGDGDTEDTIPLTIEYDAKAHPETNGYSGTYLDLYLAEFQQSLQDYLNRLDYTEGWTWFDADGNALSDSEVAAMTSADKANAFLSGRYAKSNSDSEMARPGGGAPGGNGSGDSPDGSGFPGGNNSGEGPGGTPPDAGGPGDGSAQADSSTKEVGTPDAGTTQASGSGTDSANYSSFEEMVQAYSADIAEIEAGDTFGNNIVNLYDPTRFIGAEGTNNPTWARILMGASEGDISLLNSLNLQVAWLNAGTDADIEWQWDGGHVPSEILGDSFSLYVDQMYGKYAEGAKTIDKAEAEAQTTNGTESAATGSDRTDWINYDAEQGVSFTLADAAAYRTAGASKAIPSFDVMDYGQEDYVFGSASADARHWDKHVLDVFQKHSDTLAELFNAEN